MPSIRADRNQMYLLPPAIEEWIKNDHLARFVVEFIEVLPLEEMGFKMEEETGRPGYAVDMLLGAWIYGILEGKKSSRKVEKMTMDSIGLIWITGDKHPDHNTLWRFFKDNKKQIRLLVKETVQVAIKNDLIGFEIQALDGTKIQADVNKEKTKTIRDTNKRIEKLDKEIDEIMREIENNEKQDEEEGKGSLNMPEKLREKDELRKKMKDHVERMKKEGKTNENPADKDSRFMKMRGKGLQQAYNSQAVVDARKQIIVAEKVTNNESDAHMLNEMIEKAEETTGSKAGVTLADGGYYSPEELVKSGEKKRNIVIKLPGDDSKNPYGKAHFEYNKEKNEYICPKNGKLEFAGKRKKKSGKETIVYRCRNYKECMYRYECSKAKSGRIIEAHKYEEVVSAYRARARTENWKEQLKKRQTIVEPLFGRIKNILGFTRFSVRGIENVQTQWSFICSVHNIKTMYALWREDKIKLRFAAV